eukprot:525880-Hanusia_phi.AAC.2
MYVEIETDITLLPPLLLSPFPPLSFPSPPALNSTSSLTIRPPCHYCYPPSPPSCFPSHFSYRPSPPLIPVLASSLLNPPPPLPSIPRSPGPSTSCSGTSIDSHRGLVLVAEDRTPSPRAHMLVRSCRAGTGSHKCRREQEDVVLGCFWWWW